MSSWPNPALQKELVTVSPCPPDVHDFLWAGPAIALILPAKAQSAKERKYSATSAILAVDQHVPRGNAEVLCWRRGAAMRVGTASAFCDGQ